MARKQRKWIGWFFALVILVVLAAGAYQFYLHFRFPVTGIDVSHHNGAIDWPRVKDQGYYFAFIKATEGRTLVDEDFSNHQAGARKVGMLTGAYHYFLPDLDAKAQAQHFLKIAKPKSGDLRPVLDVEETRGKSAAEIQKGVRIWLETVEAAVGARPIVYSSTSFAADYLGAESHKSPLWIASLHWWEPKVPEGWTEWAFWQHSQTARVQGIQEKTDLNYFSGAFHDLEQFRLH